MIERVRSIFEFRLNEKNQKLTINLDPDIPKLIITDEQRLAQVITNLIGNAIKFTPDQGSITLTARKLDNTPFDSSEGEFCYLEFNVTDTGIGIPKDQQGNLFQSFVQADSSIARKFGGTGLGLAISKKIVELMRGEVNIVSDVGKGSSFIFTIHAKIPVSSDETASTPSESVIEETCNYTGKRVLLAEDVEINREIVITLLEPLGIEVIEAEDGQKAYDLFHANADTIDLIFMDIHMPSVNGYDSARLIRANEHPRAKTVPIIAMTANVFKEDVDQCLAAGMNDHIGKPVDFDIVIATLKKYLG
jgi:CheY-like chemotaxis protein